MHKNSKILFIDGQVFQSAAWDRGMGKYSLSLLKALVNDNAFDYKEATILFSKNLPLDPSILHAIKSAGTDLKHKLIDLRVPDDPCQADISKLQKLNESLLTDLMEEYTGKEYTIDYLILSLFIDQVCSVFPMGAVRKVLLFYDLIPFQYHERYAELCTFKGYLTRFKTLFEADFIWTISQTVADDLALHLGISDKKLFNIDGAPVERAEKAKTPKTKISNDYILMPSGNDLRKNNLRAVQAFENYRRNSEEELKLVITSYFDEGTKSELEAHSSNLIFTSNVAEDELKWLYENSRAILFVSEYEGLGLPILEAAESGKPIICSNLSVFYEMSEEAFYYSDPYDPYSISDSISAALKGIGFSEKVKEYPIILGRYTWKNTAKKALEALALSNAAKQQVDNKIKLAILAPSPAGYSDIGKRVLQLHPSMSEYFDIDYYLENGRTHKQFTRPDYLKYVTNTYDVKLFNESSYKKYDAVLYHIGNSEFHIDTIRSALYLPAFAVFHDTHLANIFNGELLQYNYISKPRLEAEKGLEATRKTHRTSYITSLANRQLAIITHSRYAQDAISDTLIEPKQVVRTNLPLGTPRQLRKKLSEGEVTIGFAGIIHPAKGLDIIETIARSDKFYHCKIHIFGLSLVHQDVINRLESYPNVSVDTNITDFQFQNMLSDVDILVNYRKDYRGETSAATLEALRFGSIPIVRDIGWYSEMPDDVVIKVKSSDDIPNVLEELVYDAKRRRMMVQKGRKLLADQFTYNDYAKNIYDLINSDITRSSSLLVAEAIKKGENKSVIKSLLYSVRKDPKTHKQS